MKRLWKVTCVITWVLTTLPAVAQTTGTIEGTVTNTADEALPGVNVVVQGTIYGTTTDYNGRFAIVGLAPGTYDVQVSFVGFETVTRQVIVQAERKATVRFTLEARALPMNEVMVTSLRARAARTQSISTVTEEEIERSPHVGAYDVFKATPGVHVMQGHAIGYGLASRPAGRILIRGLGRRAGGDLRIRGIQVLVDGMPDFSQSHGHPFPDVHALDNISRIEIIKGPASVRYGNAMAGAIIMTTKTPESGLNYYVKGSGGSWTTTENVARVGYGGQRGYAQVSGNLRHTDGHRVDAADALTAYNASVKMGYELAPDLALDLNGLIGAFEWDNPGPGGLPGGETSWMMGDLNLVYRFSQHRASVKLWGVDGEARFRNGLDEPITQFGLKSKADLAYGIGRVATVGLDWMNYDIARNDVSQGQFNEVAPYVIVEHRISTRILVEAGLRFTYNEQFGEDLSPEIGALYRPVPQTTLRGRIAHGFRTPNAFETTFGGDANPDLDAADLWQVELGVNHTFADRVTLDVTGFLQEGDNMIRSEPAPGTPAGRRLANTGEFSHKGIEAAVTVRATDNLAFTATSTNLDLEDDTALAPHNIYTFGVAFSPQAFTFEVNGRYATELYNQDDKQDKLDNYFVLDAQGSYQVNRWVRVFVAAHNLFDEDYEIVKGFPRPGAGVFAGLIVKGR